jgi:hypothetical protein
MVLFYSWFSIMDTLMSIVNICAFWWMICSKRNANSHYRIIHRTTKTEYKSKVCELSLYLRQETCIKWKLHMLDWFHLKRNNFIPWCWIWTNVFHLKENFNIVRFNNRKQTSRIFDIGIRSEFWNISKRTKSISRSPVHSEYQKVWILASKSESEYKGCGSDELFPQLLLIKYNKFKLVVISCLIFSFITKRQYSHFLLQYLLRKIHILHIVTTKKTFKNKLTFSTVKKNKESLRGFFDTYQMFHNELK